ncbi:T9SS type A sorting domain-containing protein [Mesohalobacter halotolerans]|nr:T9SS type A sorting domain-containing protein [Mesohalobacter halotolerans]
MNLILFAFLPFFGFGQATTQTNEDNYVLVALKSGTNSTWTVPAGVEKIDYLIVGGGGGYGNRGGGGAGAFYEATDVSVTPGASINYTIGAGGASGNSTSAGSNGGHTTFNGITAYGGGGGTATEQYNLGSSDMSNRPVYKSSFTNGEGGSGGGGMASPKHNWNGRSDGGSGSEITNLGSDDRGGLGGDAGTAGSNLFRNKGGDSQSIFFVFGDNTGRSFWIGAGGGGAGEPGRDVAWVGNGEFQNGVISSDGSVITLTSANGTAGFVPGAGGKGKASTLLSATSANELGIGQVDGTEVYFAGGGGARANYNSSGLNLNQLTKRDLVGSPGLGSVGANTGGGGTSAPGKDGVVLIRYLAPPSNLKIAPRTSDFDLSWTAPNNATGLTGYEYSTDNGSSWTATGSTSNTTTVAPGDVCSTYTFLVRAVYGSNKSAAASVTGKGCNDITIVASGGADEDSGWSAVNGIIAATQDVSINASDVESYLTSGDLTIEAVNITVDATVSTSSSNNFTLEATNDVLLNESLTFTAAAGTLTIKSGRHIRLGTEADVTSTTAALNAQFWADTDQDADGIVYIESESIDTNGGHLTFGENGQTASVGGETILVGGDVFFQRSTSVQTLTTSGGAVNIYGETIVANTNGLTIDSGNGNVTLHGLLNSGNQYSFTSTVDNYRWTSARVDAKNGTGGGSTLNDSYLVTITSRLENSIAGLTANYQSAWIGAYRDRNTNIGSNDTFWYWADGPEANQHFYTQSNGSTVAGYYSNFMSGEPNGTGTSGESFGQFFGAEGFWNDLKDTGGSGEFTIKGYVSESNLAPSPVVINAGSGDVYFGGGVGTAKELASLNVTSSATTVIGNGLVTTGAQTFSSSLTVNSAGSTEQVRIAAGSGNDISAGGDIEIFGKQIDLGADLNTSMANGNILLQAPTLIDALGAHRILNAGSGNITLTTDEVESGVNTPNRLIIETTGTFTLEPSSTAWPSSFVVGTFFNFDGAVSSGNFVGASGVPESAWLQINSIASLGGLTLGRAGSTSGIAIDSPILISGPISVFGSVITVKENLTSTATSGSGISITGQRIFQVNGIDVTTSGADISYTAVNFVSTAAEEDLISLDGSGANRALVNANGGNIILTANYATGGTAGNSERSIRLMSADLMTSGAGEISLTGDATNSGNTTQTAWGMQADDARIITDAGNITMTMTGGAVSSNSRGLALDGQNMQLLSSSGTITVRDIQAADLTGNYNGLYLRPNAANTILFGADGSEVASSSSDIIIEADRITFDEQPTRFNTSGTLSIRPVGASFEANINTANVNVESTATGLTIGKPGSDDTKTTIGRDHSINGPIHIYSYDIDIDAKLEAVNDQILLSSAGAYNTEGTLELLANANLIADELLIRNFHRAYVGFNSSVNFVGDVSVNKLASDGADWLFVNNTKALSIETIAGVNGVSTSGFTRVYTESGDLTLNAPLSSTLSGSTAVRLYADRDEVAGETGDGHIKITNTGEVNIESDARALFYSGNKVNSTGLIDEIGGIANSRTSIDATSDLNSINPALGNTGKYALLRVAEGTGDFTIVASGGDAINSTWAFDNGILTTIDSPVNVNASDVEDYLATGDLTIEAGNITVDAAVSSSSGNSLALMAENEINLEANLTTTNNGDISLYTDNALGGLSTPRTLTAAGAFKYIPNGSAFASDVTYPITNLTVTSSGLTIGKPGNNKDITINTEISGDAGVELYGNELNINDNINVTNTGNLIFDGVATIKAGKHIASGGNFTHDGDLVFKSDAANGDSYLGEIGGNYTKVAGTVISEKYYPAKRAFRMVSSSVTGGSIFDNWQNAGVNDAGIGTHITGEQGTVGNYNATTGIDYTQSGAPSLFSFSAGWNAVTNTKTTDLEVGVPYRLMVRGDRNVDLNDNEATPSETILKSIGDLEVGTENITFPSATAGSNTFAFIANPYQSRIDVSEVLAANSSKADDTKLWVWDPMINTRGGFVTIDQFSSGNGTATPFVAGENSSATKFIEPGQAFFIQLSGSDSNISFTESVKDVSNLSQSPESLSQQPQLLFNLHNEDQEVIDAIRLRFSPDGNNDIDQLDISKLGNMDENLASVNGNSLFTIQKRSLPETDEEISLFTNNWRNENYSFSANLNNLEATDVYLVDHYLGTETLISNGTAYSFSVDANISESVSSLRFALRFDNETMGVEEQEKQLFSLYPNPAKDIVNIQTSLPLGSQATVEVYNMLGQLVISQTQTISHTSIGIGVDALEAGVYLVKLTGQDGYSQTQELIKE